ncbi:MAG: glycosyltransferase family 9 protein [Nibricoccus sp.]
MRRVLIIKPKRMGDMLLLTPTLSALKAEDPRIHINILTYDKSAKILEDFPKIDHVWTVTGDGREQKLTKGSEDLLDIHFDDVIDLSGQPYAAKVLHDCIGTQKFRSILYGNYGASLPLAERCSIEKSQPAWADEHAMLRDWLVIKYSLEIHGLPKPKLDFPVRDTNFPALTPPIAKRFAVFHPFSSHTDRTWSSENWRALAIELLNHRIVEEVIIPFGSENERHIAAWIADGITGCRVPEHIITFAAHAALVRRTTICVTSNTGVMHLAVRNWIAHSCCLGRNSDQSLASALRYIQYCLRKSDYPS